jgi:hypothetical protein
MADTVTHLVATIASKDRNGNSNPVLVSDMRRIFKLVIQPKTTHFCLEWFQVPGGAQPYTLTFDMKHIKEIAISTNQQDLSIELNDEVQCYIAKVACQHFAGVAVTQIVSLELHCTEPLHVDVVRQINDAYERKQRQTRIFKKRAREPCGSCECCMVNPKLHQAQAHAKEVQELRQKCDELGAAVRHMKDIKMDPEFERDTYNPLVVMHTKNVQELTDLKKSMLYTQVVPCKFFGTFRPEILRRANLTEEEASELLQETLQDPTFGPTNPKVEYIRARYGAEVLFDALRCVRELDDHNASGGYPVVKAWNYNANREMSASEIASELVACVKEKKR